MDNLIVAELEFRKYYIKLNIIEPGQAVLLEND